MEMVGMKNSISTLIIGTILLSVSLGCGFASRGQKDSKDSHDKTLTDKGIEIATGNERIGVQECDDLMDSIEEQSRSEDDNYVTKAMKGYFLNKIRESVKKSIEENKNDKVQMAKECKDFKIQLDKQLAEQEKEKK
jgi:hypothetical protein